MRSISRTALAAVMWLGVAAGTSACVPPPPPTGAVFVVRRPPPYPREFPGRRPGEGFIWMTGFWRWDGGAYFWAPGRWTRVERGYHAWVPGRWRHERRGWYWVGGYWR